MTGFARYRPGRSALHATPAWLKLLALAAACVGAAFVREPAPAIWALAVVVCLYFVAELGPRTLWQQVRPTLWFLVPATFATVVVGGVDRAATLVCVALALALLALLVTLTTRATEMLNVVVRLLTPLRWVGADPERVGIALMLAARKLPVLSGLAREGREAQFARGLDASPRAFAVPLAVRALQHSDQMRDALAARGMDR